MPLFLHISFISSYLPLPCITDSALFSDSQTSNLCVSVEIAVCLSLINNSHNCTPSYVSTCHFVRATLVLIKAVVVTIDFTVNDLYPFSVFSADRTVCFFPSNYYMCIPKMLLKSIKNVLKVKSIHCFTAIWRQFNVCLQDKPLV